MSKEKGKRKKKKENYCLLRGPSQRKQTALKHPVSTTHTLTEFLPSLPSTVRMCREQALLRERDKDKQLWLRGVDRALKTRPAGGSVEPGNRDTCER